MAGATAIDRGKNACPYGQKSRPAGPVFLLESPFGVVIEAMDTLYTGFSPVIQPESR